MNDKITVKELAAIKGVNVSTARRWCLKGQIEAERVGRDWFIPCAAAEVFELPRAGRPRKWLNLVPSCHSANELWHRIEIFLKIDPELMTIELDYEGDPREFKNENDLLDFWADGGGWDTSPHWTLVQDRYSFMDSTRLADWVDATLIPTLSRCGFRRYVSELDGGIPGFGFGAPRAKDLPCE